MRPVQRGLIGTAIVAVASIPAYRYAPAYLGYGQVMAGRCVVDAAEAAIEHNATLPPDEQKAFQKKVGTESYHSFVRSRCAEQAGIHTIEGDAQEIKAALNGWLPHLPFSHKLKPTDPTPAAKPQADQPAVHIRMQAHCKPPVESSNGMHMSNSAILPALRDPNVCTGHKNLQDALKDHHMPVQRVGSIRLYKL